MKSLFFMKVRFERNLEKAKAHIKYVGFRAREMQNEVKGFFDKEHDKGANWEDFYSKVNSSKVIRHPWAVKVHKLTLSMRELDYKAYERSGKNYKDLTREFMKRMEYETGLKLDWIAAEHQVKGHPHVHVIVKSSGFNMVTGKEHKLFLGKDELKLIKDFMTEHIQQHAQYTFAEQATEFLRKNHNAMMSAINAAFNDSERDAEIKRARSMRRLRIRAKLRSQGKNDLDQSI